MPDDYFGRLLARYAPPAPADPFAGPPDGGPAGRAGASRRTLVRPRLPGPFERIEALGGAPAGPEAPAPLYPRAPLPAALPGEPVHHERELRTTDRETVVRSEAPHQDTPDRGRGAPRPAAPPGRPAAPPVAGPRTAVPDAVRPHRRSGGRAGGEDGPARTPASAPVAGHPEPAAPAAAPALRPRTDAVPTARPEARAAAAGRRGQRPAERVVHVQIGRLEVSAAGTERPAAGGRPAGTGRRAPSLSLTDYLARGERAN
ncbi:hypothetical protein ACFCVY_07715 [Streptomyces sp. NPDC056411]|uniref:hypothetical protein n=1 Tax=Streptomyces sp. NPDC056411 TaxID=3345813 RepID=UPI0035E377EB